MENKVEKIKDNFRDCDGYLSPSLSVAVEAGFKGSCEENKTLKKQLAVAVDTLGWIRDIDGKSFLEMNLTTLEITATSAIKSKIMNALKQIEEMNK